MATEFPPDWYVDPSDSTRVRYWNGKRWTQDTWSLAEAKHVVSSGPVPPVRIDLDADDPDPEPEIAPSRKSPRTRIIGTVLLAVAVVAALALAWYRFG